MVEYSTCIPCLILEKIPTSPFSCRKIRVIHLMVLRLLPLDSPEVQEHETYAQHMSEHPRK